MTKQQQPQKTRCWAPHCHCRTMCPSLLATNNYLKAQLPLLRRLDGLHVDAGAVEGGARVVEVAREGAEAVEDLGRDGLGREAPPHVPPRRAPLGFDWSESESVSESVNVRPWRKSSGHITGAASTGTMPGSQNGGKRQISQVSHRFRWFVRREDGLVD